MILFLAAAVATAAPQASSCGSAGTPDALVCKALDAQRRGVPDEAAQDFDKAANASADKGAAKARLLAAAGNLWIEAKQPGKAAFDLDAALAIPALAGDQRGEVLLDRARAAEAQDDLVTARAKVTQAAQIIPSDPFTWYFSAALAIRENDPGTAESAINHALTLAPNDPAVLFEAGHVADFLGDTAKARGYWMRAAAGDSGEIGKAAAKAIELLGVVPVVKMDAPPPK